MANYHFTTHWRFDAPLERVWQEIKAMGRWPEWWRYVKKVELLHQGGADDIGSVRRITWKTALPYTLTFDSELVSEEKHRRMEGRAFGELEGTGIWTFSTENGATLVRYDWIVKTTQPWMNLLAPIARPFFAWNHDKLMQAGFEGLKQRLTQRCHLFKQFQTMEETTKISPLEVVQQCYADFGSGNIPGVLDALTDKIEWTDPGQVGDLYTGLRKGKAAVAEFFTNLNQRLNITQFDLNEYIAKGKKVVANGHVAGTARATGKPFASDFSMTWRVNKNGKVSRHHLYLDTYNIARAMGLAS